MRTSLVLPEHLINAWPEVEPILEKAIERSNGRWRTADLRNQICTEEQHLWVSFDDDGIHGAVTTRIIDYPNTRALSVEFCAGSDTSTWKQQMLDTLERFAKQQQCALLQMTGRKGWERFLKEFGWKPIAVTCEKEIS